MKAILRTRNNLLTSTKPYPLKVTFSWEVLGISILNAGEMQLCAIPVSLRGENDFRVLFHTIPIVKIATFA